MPDGNAGTVSLADAQDMLGLRNSAMTRTDADVAELIVTDEFHKREKSDYRERALTRLCRLPYRWHSDGNILTNMVERLVSVACPRCGGPTTQRAEGGCNDSMTFSFTCEDGNCGQKISLTLADDAFMVYESVGKLAEEAAHRD